MNRAERDAFVAAAVASGGFPSSDDLEQMVRDEREAREARRAEEERERRQGQVAAYRSALREEARERRFLGKISIDDSGCWLWTGTKWASGYARMYVDKKQTRVHRWAYEHYVGSIPEGRLVCHHCDVRHCVNPEHLFLGGHDDNMADMVAKERSHRGRPRALRNVKKLTDYQVREMRRRYADGEEQIALAASFGVSQSLVSRIVRRLAWQHIVDDGLGALPSQSSHRARLSVDDQARIRSLRADGMSQKAIAAHVGVSQERVSQILRLTA